MYKLYCHFIIIYLFFMIQLYINYILRFTFIEVTIYKLLYDYVFFDLYVSLTFC